MFSDSESTTSHILIQARPDPSLQFATDTMPKQSKQIPGTGFPEFFFFETRISRVLAIIQTNLNLAQVRTAAFSICCLLARILMCLVRLAQLRHHQFIIVQTPEAPALTAHKPSTAALPPPPPVPVGSSSPPSSSQPKRDTPQGPSPCRRKEDERRKRRAAASCPAFWSRIS